MAKRGTRKIRTRKSKSGIMSIPALRKAFDHMDNVVEHLRKTAAHSFSDAVSEYREEWRKVFKRDLSPADAQAYLKFRYGIKKGSKTRKGRMHGGGAPLAGAPLDYSTRPGVDGAYGNFPTYQTQGLDRYYSSAITADCGKPNSFPTDGSAASQRGGGALDGLFRPLAASAPVGTAYATMMEYKGSPSYPSADPVGQAPLRTPAASYMTTANLTTHIRTLNNDVYSR